jgi:hypothetical protein
VSKTPTRYDHVFRYGDLYAGLSYLIDDVEFLSRHSDCDGATDEQIMLSERKLILEYQETCFFEKLRDKYYW